ncbi:unnamed protein product [Caenorhabditis auriculariae]|uniref:SET domain-containing protein n=1 Tax=Caenorhabditis auriculariae TaxID=2777116 RepID=A0A8S1HFS0_9PELO|nr:unnamed protein product [Caenorhabditis auriculariae]
MFIFPCRRTSSPNIPSSQFSLTVEIAPYRTENELRKSFLCDGVTVAYDKKRGRFIKATKDLNPGTIICIEEGVTVNVKRGHCYNCLRLVKVSDLYCDKCSQGSEPIELARGDFDDLGIFKLSAHILLSYPFVEVIRAIDQPNIVPPKSAPSHLSSTDFSSILQLEPHSEIAKVFDDPAIQMRIKKFVDLLGNHPKWGAMEVSERFVKFSKALRIVSERCARNSHVVYDIVQTTRKSKEEPMGTGIFPISSIFNHSCTPNVFSFFIGNVFVFVSRGVLAGQELVDTYGVTKSQNCSAKRKRFLAEHSGFTCNCPCCQLGHSMDQFLISAMNSPETLVYSATHVNDFWSFVEFIPPGHKDLEVLVEFFAQREDAKADPRTQIQLWENFLTNAEKRKISFDPYLVRPLLELVLAFHDDSLIRDEQYEESRMSMMIALHEHLHVFYCDLHPASGPLKMLLEATNKKEGDIREPLGLLKEIAKDLTG